MGLFGNLFEKKNCEICGKELGLFGKHKLSEGYICGECSDKLSPFFTGRRQSTVEQIREQLAYREENKRKLASFNPTRTVDAGNRKIYIDEDNGCFIITGSSNWRDANPDIISFDQVTGCDVDIDESRTEIMREDAEGNRVSYNPKRYEYDYDFDIKVYFSHPYFSETSWQVNTRSIDNKMGAEYRDCQDRANEAREVLTGLRSTARAAKAPKSAVTCPHCFASTIPDAQGRCEYCGGSLADVLA